DTQIAFVEGLKKTELYIYDIQTNTIKKCLNFYGIILISHLADRKIVMFQHAINSRTANVNQEANISIIDPINCTIDIRIPINIKTTGLINQNILILKNGDGIVCGLEDGTIQ